MAFNLVHAHAMTMILSWLFFGSTGILFARYGRQLRWGNRRQLLGKAVWFQIHRFLLSITPLLTLLGFLFILIYAGGQWVDIEIVGTRLFLHSIFGGIIVCCSIIQVWLALYRCNPHSRFRFIFAWSHRIIGFLAFSLSIPTIFLIIVLMPVMTTLLITILSIWTVWIVIIIIIFERIEFKQRIGTLLMVNNIRVGDTNQENINTNSRLDTEAGTNINIGNRRLYYTKLFLFIIHIMISLIVSILLIVFISN